MRDYAFDNPSLLNDWRTTTIALSAMPSAFGMPEGAVSRLEDANVIRQYRAGKEMACADIAICTLTPNDGWGIVLSKRKPTEPFGGKWWIQGGSVGAYADVCDFVASRAKKECGVSAPPEALVGFYRTCAEDMPQSTTQPCFVTRINYNDAWSKISTDANHDSVRVLVLEEVQSLPIAAAHWYPLHIATRVLRAAAELFP